VPSGRHYLAAAVGLPLGAAFLWAAYYVFVLGVTPGTAPSAVLAYPFLFGGVAYVAWTVAQGHGAAFVALWTQPAAYGRVALLLGMQLSVLASTYLAGPVDTSLLSLIGDVVLTPIVVAGWVVGYRGRFGSPVLWLGMGMCLVGGGLAIVGGGGLVAVHNWGYLVVVTIPVTVAFFFLMSARANEHAPASAVVGQAMLAAGIIGVAIAPALPGGFGGLAIVRPIPLAILGVTGVTSFFLAPAMYFESIRRVGLVIPPLLMTGIPVFAGILGWAVLGIAIPPLGIVGIPVAVAGAILALRGETAGAAPTGSAPSG
jgi:drug/metabolite transporter (DMT)-like permease